MVKFAEPMLQPRFGLGMSILVFAIIILIVAGLLLAVVRTAPIEQPFNWIVQVLIILVAALVIGHRAGLF